MLVQRVSLKRFEGMGRDILFTGPFGLRHDMDIGCNLPLATEDCVCDGLL